MNMQTKDLGLSQLLDDSLKKLDRLSAAVKNTDTADTVNNNEIPQSAENTEPDTAANDNAEDPRPSAADPRVYEQMVAQVRKRRSRNKSIWTNTPVIPVRKSVWLDAEEQTDDTSEETLPDNNISLAEPKNSPAQGIKKSFLMKMKVTGSSVPVAVNITELSDNDKPVEVRRISVLSDGGEKK